jgi:hypothetical protein
VAFAGDDLALRGHEHQVRERTPNICGNSEHIDILPNEMYGPHSVPVECTSSVIGSIRLQTSMQESLPSILIPCG